MRIPTKPNIPTIGDRREDGGNVVKLWDVRTERKICSNDQIIMKTVDKERYPLPDPAILDMQWILHGITALSAGPKPPEELSEEDDDHDEDYDDEYYNYGYWTLDNLMWMSQCFRHENALWSIVRSAPDI